MNAGRQWQFGNHRAVLGEPDVIRVTFNGPMVFEDAHRVLAIYRCSGTSRTIARASARC